MSADREPPPDRWARLRRRPDHGRSEARSRRRDSATPATRSSRRTRDSASRAGAADGATDARLPVTVAVVKQVALPKAVEDVRVGDHLAIPPLRRWLEPGELVLPLPCKPVSRLRVTQAIALAPGAEPHSVTTVLAEYARAGDRELRGIAIVDADVPRTPPTQPVQGLGVLDVVVVLRRAPVKLPARAR